MLALIVAKKFKDIKGEITMIKFNPGDLVQIKTSSKSKFKEAIGTVVGYCHGDYSNIC